MTDLSRWLGRVIIGGALTLLAGSALAFGAVHRSAFVALEAVICALFALWMISIAREAPGMPRLSIARRDLRHLVTPAIVLAGWFGLQMVPLPPVVLRAIAPMQYRLYQVAFPGWSGVAPFQPLASLTDSDARSATVSATSRKMPPTDRREGPIADLPRPAVPLMELGAHRWRTLSIAPSVTASATVEWLALELFFLLILLFPFGLVGEADAELRFYRAVTVGLLAIGSMLAVIALAERAWWNGKLLWLYVPADWGGRLVATPRASGPFVDPDHFANYLAMILPLALVATAFPRALFRGDQRANLQLGAALGGLLMVGALFLSFSRGGWIAAIAGSAVALTLSIRHAPSLAPAIMQKFRGRRTGVLLVVAFAAGLSLLLLFAGSTGRGDAGARLTAAVSSGGDLQYRPAVWHDTLDMIRDFPLFGVGLGAWPDFFPHYQRPPWMPFFFREAENDYLQFAAEAGILGVVILGWLGFNLGGTLRRGAGHLRERNWPLFAGLIGGLIAGLSHAAVDFSLHTPANALLFVLLGALALRLALVNSAPREGPQLRTAEPSSRLSYGIAAAGLAVALGLTVLVFTQDGRTYPYGVGSTNDWSRLEAEVAVHPGMSSAHQALAANLAGEKAAALRLAELRAAVWLDPNNPGARDRYARGLLMTGQKAEGLAQITASAYRAPQARFHYYLAPALVPWLLPEEQTAVAAGLMRAADQDFPGALAETAALFSELGRYRDLARLYERALQAAIDPRLKIEYMVEAGSSYARAGDNSAAITMLHAAIALAPADPRPYAELVRAVFGPAGRLGEAQAIIERGKQAGADPVRLDLALADAAEAADDRGLAESALEQAQHSSDRFAIAMRLGSLYLADKKDGAAVQNFAHATELNPHSAAAWFALGQAQEQDYAYAAASAAYARARSLEPANTYYQSVYSDLVRRTAQSSP